MKVILLENVKRIGSIGEVIDVKRSQLQKVCHEVSPEEMRLSRAYKKIL